MGDGLTTDGGTVLPVTTDGGTVLPVATLSPSISAESEGKNRYMPCLSPPRTSATNHVAFGEIGKRNRSEVVQEALQFLIYSWRRAMQLLL